MNREYPGKIFLRYCGILLIISGGLYFLNCLVYCYGFVKEYGGAYLFSASVLPLLITTIASAFFVIGGFMGLKLSKKREKAKTCFIIGLVMVFLMAAAKLLGLYLGGVSTSGVVESISMILLPLLFTYGAWINRSAMEPA